MTMMENNREISKARSPIMLLTIICLLTAAVLAWLGWSNYHSFREGQLTRDRTARIEQLQGQIIYLDEVLTMSARMAAAVGDTKWEDRYRKFELKLDSAIKEVIRLAPKSSSVEGAVQTDAANIALVNMENQAFDLIRKGNAKKAQTILLSAEYKKQKEVYAKGMEQFYAHLEKTAALTKKNEAKLAYLRVAGVIFVGLILFVGWGALLKISQKWRGELSKKNRELHRQAKELTSLNTTLECRVAERTNDMEASQIAALNMMADAVKARAASDLAEKKTHQILAEVERANSLMVGREKRMIKLKNEVNELARKAGIDPPYKSIEQQPPSNSGSAVSQE